MLRRKRDTHWTVSASSSSKLQLSKGISGVFRGVLFTVPLADHMITCRYGCMNVPCSTTLAQSPINATDRQREIKRETREREREIEIDMIERERIGEEIEIL